MDKENVEHLHNEILFSYKENKIMILTDEMMEPEAVILSEVM